jgi:hypothetical protein
MICGGIVGGEFEGVWKPHGELTLLTPIITYYPNGAVVPTLQGFDLSLSVSLAIR